MKIPGEEFSMTDVISDKISRFMIQGSWIRKMFEQGAELKAIHGKDNVYDFSIGNPMGEPPPQFINALREAIDDDTPGTHSYMPNAGLPYVRKILASHLVKDHGVPLEAKHLVFTVGAAGALNVALKALINESESVMIFAPYFVEYKFYIDNVSGKSVIVETDAEFNLDIEAIRQAFTPSVKAIILNTPNNPTGRVYSEQTLTALADFLRAQREKVGHPIYILSDEPYKRIVYDGIQVPSLLKLYDQSLVCTSYSKELSIPGERLGYIAVSPACPGADTVIDALTFCNRILGFVNAPALFQRALGLAPEARVDISEYAKNRETLLSELGAMGYRITRPDGAFYLFIESPLPDDTEFVRILAEEKILAVPGLGFGRAGYFRLSFCVKHDMILRSLPGFKRALEQAKSAL